MAASYVPAPGGGASLPVAPAYPQGGEGPYYPPGYGPGQEGPPEGPPDYGPPGYGPPGYGAMPLDPRIGYELYATVGGYGVPLSVAIPLRRLGLVQFHLLGGFQGDSQLGFQLSGPYGPVMTFGLESGRTPAMLGTPAYIGTHHYDRSRGSHVALLTGDWLYRNLGPDWMGLAAGGL